MLLAIRETPNKVVVPSLRGKNMRKERLTWALNINRAETVNLEQQQSPLEMPLINNEAFMIRTDLYKVSHLLRFCLENNIQYCVSRAHKC